MVRVRVVGERGKEGCGGDWWRSRGKVGEEGLGAEEGLVGGEELKEGSEARSCCRSISSDMRVRCRGGAGVEISGSGRLGGGELVGWGLDLAWPIVIADRTSWLGWGEWMRLQGLRCRSTHLDIQSE